MGSICSIERDHAPGEKEEQGQRRNSNTLTRTSSKRLQKQQRHDHHKTSLPSLASHQLTHHHKDVDMAQEMIDAQDKVIAGAAIGAPKRRLTTVLDGQRTRSEAAAAPITSVTSYHSQRDEIARRESTLSFDYRTTATASAKEKHVNAIIQAVKAQDKIAVYDAAEPRLGWGGQKHPRFPADHFLSNVDLIEKTELFSIAQKMPKGAHLHIHFNACLKPDVLLGIAKERKRMFITSDLPLARGGAISQEAADIALHRCEIQFSILGPGKEHEKQGTGNCFSPQYAERQWMKYSQFLDEFPGHHNGQDPDEWLASKLLFHEEEAHNHLQTVQGSWAKFNGRTRMMKGLFNYESAYRKYTRGILEDFQRDNIQYAEIRPNFMPSNQLWTDDGVKTIDNHGIMEIIIQEYINFQAGNKDKFVGLKVIYCTPRSFKNEQVAQALAQCLEFKQKWPEWIAGFDLVGEESQGRPLRDFVPEFLEFKENCKSAKGGPCDIPFLFHCGETLEVGNDTDGNLLDALLLGSKRIGHGFALARHPYIMEHMKKNGVCLELCPISNEELGLTPRVTGHAMYNLLANNVHCTLNSDNGTIFRSSLSHDFYQAMVGKTNMTLYGWKQLIEWSLDHSCMSKAELESAVEDWKRRWEEFLDWVIEEYGGN